MLFNQTTFLNFINILAVERNLENLVQHVAISAYREKAYNNVLFISGYEEMQESFFPAHILLQGFNDRPTYIFNESENWTALKKISNEYALVILHLSGCKICNKEILKNLWKLLKSMTIYRSILFIDAAVNESFIEDLLHFCRKHKAFYTIALEPTVLVTNHYYTFQMFPEFSLESREIDWTMPEAVLFPTHDNLYGHAIKVGSPFLPPYSFTMKNKDNELILAGAYETTVAEFARQLNGTVTYPLRDKLTGIWDSDVYMHYLANDTFDISTIPMIKVNESLGVLLSTALELTDVCIIVPMERELPHSIYFFIIFKKSVVLLLLLTLVLAAIVFARCERENPFWYYLFNPNFVFLILGLTVFTKRLMHRRWMIQRYIFVILTLSGVIWNSLYVAFLQSFATQNPKQPILGALDDIVQSGLTVYAADIDYYNIKKHAAGFSALFPNLVEYTNYTIYNKNRDQFPQAGFIMHTLDWQLYDLLQRYVGRRVHRITDVCPFVNQAGKVATAPNSIYSRRLNTFIDRLHQSGIQSYWFDVDFYKFLRSLNFQLSSFKGTQNRHIVDPIEMEDLYLIFRMYLMLMTLSICCFVVELYWSKHEYINLCKILRFKRKNRKWKIFNPATL